MNILFLHRLELVHLYAPVAMELEQEHNIIHVAFDDQAEKVLTQTYGIVASHNISQLRDDYYQSATGSREEELDKLDSFILENTKGRFCLSSSMHLDRTYKNLELNDSYDISLAYFHVWEKIFRETRPTLLFHEPPALFVTHLAVMFCKASNAHYLTQIHVVGVRKLQWLFLSGDDATPIELNAILSKGNSYDEKGLVNAENFVNNFKGEDNVLFSEVAGATQRQVASKTVLMFRRLFGLVFRLIRRELKKSNGIQPKEHISKFLENNNKDIFRELENIFGRIFLDLYSSPNKNDKYFFYPLHLEPEAVVLYYAEGWYNGQVKLIENIAMQLPPNTFLYVKDHPHGGQYRDIDDFKRIITIKNVKLIQPDISGKSIIRNSLGVITINGTAGFEALLLNKYVFCFGKAFYTSFKGVVYLNEIKKLREAIYRTNFNEENNFDIEEINCFLKCSHEGFVGYFSNRHLKLGIDSDVNSKIVANGISSLISGVAGFNQGHWD